MMLTLLVYAYSVGIQSSRQIERLCERDIAFKVIAANQAPDHCTIARFRQENGKGIEKLFTDVLKLCAKAGLIKVGVVALDGTKVAANAALEANRTYGHIEKEVAKMLTEAETKDAEEDKLYGKEKRGDELPDDLRDPESRLKRLQECKKRLEEEAAAEAGYCSDANLEKIDPQGPEHLIATQKDWKQRQAQASAPPPRGRIPQDLSDRERMERKLRTKRGRVLYKKRSQIVEPVFGQIKTGRGIKAFMRRGFDLCPGVETHLCYAQSLEVMA
jgi:hypothetical protein